MENQHDSISACGEERPAARIQVRSFRRRTVIRRAQKEINVAGEKPAATGRKPITPFRSGLLSPISIDSGASMNILLYSPDNGVTRNFMPHLWMFLLKALTPPEHEVFLIDGNAQPMTETAVAQFVLANDIRLVGISAMTRMAARAYKVADAVRAVGAKVVFGGPHVTEIPDEPLGRTEEPRHADAIALGEADYVWPRIVADAAAGSLQEIYRPVDDNNHEVKPSLVDYPKIPWETIDLEQFNLIRNLPGVISSMLKRKTKTWHSLYVVPVESGRGCPYNCDFCTVTGFFGDAIRFRSNQSVVDELLSLKRRALQEQGTIGVFFI